MIKILAYCPKPTQVGAHLRVVLPLLYLRREMHLDVEYEMDCQIFKMATGDIVFLQRPFSDGCVERARVAKLAQCKLWLDWDDDITRIPKGNKAWEHYQFDHLRENVEKLQDMADVITVATPVLADVFNKYPEKIRLCPNAIEDHLIPEQSPVPTRKCIMWRGSDSHMVDLAEFREVIHEFAHAHAPEWKYCFFGKDPGLILNKMPENSWRNLDEIEYYKYLDIIQSFAAPIHIIPLKDNAFNRSKSNLCYIEATTAGSAVLAPDWPEWDCPGVWTYSDVEDFGQQLSEMTANLDLCAEAQSHAFEYVKEKHRLSVVNQIRKDLIEELMDR